MKLQTLQVVIVVMLCGYSTMSSSYMINGHMLPNYFNLKAYYVDHPFPTRTQEQYRYVGRHTCSQWANTTICHIYCTMQFFKFAHGVRDIFALILF